MEHPAVEEMAVASSPDPIRGEVIREQQPGGVQIWEMRAYSMMVKSMDSLGQNIGHTAYYLCDFGQVT